MPTSRHDLPEHTTWSGKFACALRGLWRGVQGQRSYVVHLPATLVVIAAGFYFKVSHAEWLALVLCVTIVLAAELFNSAIEHLARAVTREFHPELRDALDIASAAVLTTAIGASVVGGMIMVGHLWPT